MSAVMFEVYLKSLQNIKAWTAPEPVNSAPQKAQIYLNICS